MREGVIGVIDSGVGGLNVLKQMVKSVKGETFAYLGDNENVPYGNKSDRELLSLALSSVMKLSEHRIKCIILACNTLSTTVRDRLENITGIPVFGVFPPFETACLYGRKCLLIATGRTCEKFKETENVKILPCPTLAGDIERNKFSMNKVSLTDLNGKGLSNVNTVIFGCTHYEFLKIEILDHFNAERAVSGIGGTVDSVKKWLKKQYNYEKSGENTVFFVGSSAAENKKFWEEVVLRN